MASNEPAAALASPPELHLYEVLEDPDHPAFADLGRLLWILLSTQRSWIYRRVESVSLAGERRFLRHMSVDCLVPRPIAEAASDLGFRRFCVPLRILSKRPLLAFDLRLDDRVVPHLTRVQNEMAARAVLHAAVDQLGHPLTTEVASALDRVATTDEPAAPAALELLGLGRPGHAPVGAAATTEELVRWVIRTLDDNFLLLGDVAAPRLRDRMVFKVTHEFGLSIAWPPLRPSIAWEPTSLVFDAPDVVAASSYHFQFFAPEGLMVAGGELFGTNREPSDAAERGDERLPFGVSESHASGLGLNVQAGAVPEADTYNAEILLQPSPDGLLRTSAVSACVSTALLGLATAFAHRFDGPQVDASTTLLLVLPGIVSTYLARPGEHRLVSRILLGARAMLFSSALTLYIAAAILVAGVTGGGLRTTWLVLTIASAVPAGALVNAVRRSEVVAAT